MLYHLPNQVYNFSLYFKSKNGFLHLLHIQELIHDQTVELKAFIEESAVFFVFNRTYASVWAKSQQLLWKI